MDNFKNSINALQNRIDNIKNKINIVNNKKIIKIQVNKISKNTIIHSRRIIQQSNFNKLDCLI